MGLVNSDQRSPLHCALQGGHQELAKHVLVAGADVNVKDHAGDTPLHLAAALEEDNLVCTLLRRGARMDAANSKGQSSLHIAVGHGRINSARALLEAGADPNVRYTEEDSISNQCSPLYLARRNLTMTKVLLKHGADLKTQDKVGYTALHWAVSEGSPGVVEALVEGGASLEARSFRMILFKYPFKGFTPLHAASINLESMRMLLRKGANINVKDGNGQTPLHVVCKISAKVTSALTMADFMLRRGADETITDNDGYTPDDLIERDAAQAGCLHWLLVNAPADRTWRRRGMLVLCRAQTTKVLGGAGDEKSRKVSCPTEVGAGAGGGGGVCVLTRLVVLEADEVFRTIVRFL